MRSVYFIFMVSVLMVATPGFAASKSLGAATASAIMQRYQPTINAITQAGWDHSNSVVLHGMEKLHLRQPNQDYVNYIQAYADEFIRADGSIKEQQHSLDAMHPGVLCLFLYEQTGDKKYLIAASKMRNTFLGKDSLFNKTPDGAYWHKNTNKYKNVATVDGLYMIYPFLVHYGVITNDQKAIDVAIAQTLLVSERSSNIKYNLPFHAWNYDKTKPWAHPVTGTSSQFWSRASGWYSTALVDILAYLPKNHPDYNNILFLFQSLAKGLQQVQNPSTGAWHQILDAYDQENNYPEASGTGMIVYALKKGVNLGLLDKSFHEVAAKGWQALQSHISTFADGGLGDGKSLNIH